MSWLWSDGCDSVFDNDFSECIDYSQQEFSSSESDQQSNTLQSNMFYFKGNKIARQSNLSWTFTACPKNQKGLDDIIKKVDDMTNKAYLIFDNNNGIVMGYFMLKEKLTKSLLMFKMDNTWTYEVACGGCNDNKQHLEQEMNENNFYLLFSKGYEKNLYVCFQEQFKI